MRKTSIYNKTKTLISCRFVNSYWELVCQPNEENPLIYLYAIGQVIHHQVVLYWKHVSFYS